MSYKGWSLKEIANKFREGISSDIDLTSAIGNINSPLLDLPLNNSLAMKQGVGSVSFSRGSIATYIDRYGVLQTASNNEPRFEKDGLLLEGASTNEIPYSNDWTQWNSNGVTETPNFGISPDGTNNSTRLVFSGSSRTININTSANIGTLYTTSVWIKGTLNETIAIDNLGTNVAYALTGEWQRITTGYNEAAGVSVAINSYANATARDIEVYGAQLEQLPFATSYIATTNTSVNRDRDLCTIDYGNNANVDDDNTTIIECKLLSDDALGQVVYSTDIPASTMMLQLISGEAKVRAGTGSFVTYPLTSPSSWHKYATNYNGVVTQAYIDGVLVADVGASPDPRSRTKIILGSDDSVVPMYGHIKGFKTYDKILTAKEINLA